MHGITLTTDLGLQDHYAGVLKGAILKELPSAVITDISHNIMKHDISDAAYAVKNSWHYFPAGTIHIVSVDSGSIHGNRHLVFMLEDHYFIGPDNGLFSVAFDRMPETVFELIIPSDIRYPAFPARDLYVPAACHIARGGNPEMIGKKIDRWNSRTLLQPVIEADHIRGYVIYTDGYENAITNITRDHFAVMGQGKTYIIIFKRSEYRITQISSSYSDVPDGEKLALFNSSGNLEIGINKGKACSLLGLELGDMVRVEFS
ncbi:MAG: SAM-dependent chlorinase/fluorinase [Bacteroidetes bacterium]|nr:SAM-dependent chlorinase/fluorinase [Bacteroidota bacterium]